jgi:hypothetical protein
MSPNLYFYNGRISTVNNYYLAYGSSVRCVIE